MEGGVGAIVTGAVATAVAITVVDDKLEVDDADDDDDTVGG